MPPWLFVSMALSLILGAMILGMDWWRGRQPMSPHALLRYHTVPAFELIDQAGRRVSRETLAGRVWVADVIFTRCAGQCPMMSATLARVAARVHGLDGVRLVSITVDPAWDTPQVLAQYAKTYGASPDQWRFLTGSREAIQRLCTEGFQLSVDEGSGTPQEPITHSTRLVLVDQAGMIRGYYDATDADAVTQLEQDVRVLVRSRQ